MDLDTSKSFLRCLGVAQFDNRRSGWVTCACPLGPWKHQDGSGKVSFGLKLGSGQVFVKCFSCDYHGSPMDLVYHMHALAKMQPTGKPFKFGDAMGILENNPAALLDAEAKSMDEATFGGQSDFIFPEDWLSEFEPAFADGQVHPYLAGRNMPFEVARQLDLRFDPMRSRVCFPVRDYNGKLRGLHGRSIWPKVDLKYLMYTLAPDPAQPDIKRCSPDVWLGEWWVDPEKPVVVVESVFDLARVYEVYRNVMCPLMASLNEAKMKRMVGVKTVVTMFDKDKAGNVARDKLTARLKDVLFYHIELPNEGDDPGAMKVDQVAALLEQYVSLDDPLHN